MMNDFENLKLIHDFRTASTLRGYGFVFLTIAPVLFGPYVRRTPRAPPAGCLSPNPTHLRPQFAWYSDNNGLWAGVFISVFTRYVASFPRRRPDGCCALFCFLTSLFFDRNLVPSCSRCTRSKVPQHRQHATAHTHA